MVCKLIKQGFSLPVDFKNIMTIRLLIRNTTSILALAIPTGAPMTAVNKQGETQLLAPDKTNEVLPA